VAEVLYDDRYGTVPTLRSPEGMAVTTWGGGEDGILERFWRTIIGYDRVITYNGRLFDVPYLMQRSLIRDLPISRNLITGRQPEHVDVAEILTLRRATRMYGLGVWAQAIGAPSPKEGSVSGANVHEVFAMRRTKEIAEYCLLDVQATATLAERVLRLWAPLLG
jgi:DNA polymerase elongation subunit (family B)